MKFKVGDRVAVYTNHGRAVDEIQDITSTGVLLLHTMSAHYKQCRLLKKKERRVLFLKKDPSGAGYSNWYNLMETLKPGERVEFIEVLKKKVCQA